MHRFIIHSKMRAAEIIKSRILSQTHEVRLLVKYVYNIYRTELKIARSERMSVIERPSMEDTRIFFNFMLKDFLRSS